MESEKCPICKREFPDIEPSQGEAYEFSEDTGGKLVRYHSECLYSYGRLSRAEYDTLYRSEE